MPRPPNARSCAHIEKKSKTDREFCLGKQTLCTSVPPSLYEERPDAPRPRVNLGQWLLILAVPVIRRRYLLKESNRPATVRIDEPL